jgi:hypothetical protein
LKVEIFHTSSLFLRKWLFSGQIFNDVQQVSIGVPCRKPRLQKIRA